MVLATSYPFLDIVWTMLIFFAWVIWFWLLISVFADVFRRHDIGGGTKTLWILFVIIIPYLGVLIYLLVEHKGIAERQMKDQRAQQTQMDDYVKSVAAQSDPAEQIAKGKQLLDSGAITQAEFDQIKQKALAT
jgi:hypothetical protein